jgi:hypothetical protein
LIIKGHARQGGSALAKYLLQQTTHQQAKEIEAGNFGSLAQRLHEWERVAQVLTKGRKPLYHLQMRLAPGETLTQAQWLSLIDRLGKKLKLDRNERAIIAHRVHGEIHLHVVWSRLDLRAGKLIPMSHDRRHHHAVARAAEVEFGLRRLNSKARPPTQQKADRSRGHRHAA